MCVHTWCFYHLQNIFIGEDIRRQLPKESADFDDVNSNWKMMMVRFYKDPNALRGTHHPGMGTGLLKIHRSNGWVLII